MQITMKLIFLFTGMLLAFAISDEVEDDDEEVVVGDGGTIVTGVEDDVLILTHENFDLQVAKDIILVEFYAPWCGHCKALAPEYAKAAKMLKDNDPPVPLAKVDATVESDLASRFEVTGFPTLFVFRKGVKYLYEGPRSAMGIVEYMKEQADPNWKPPPISVITLTKENFTEYVTNSDLILVEFYAPWCGHCRRLAPEYERAARVLKDLPSPIPLAKVDGTEEKELADKYGASGWPTLMIFRRGTKYDYKGPRDESGIISYMKKQALPPSREATSAKSLRSSFSKKEATIVGFFESPDDPLYLQYVESAFKLREKFAFHHSFSKDLANEFKTAASKIVIYQPELFASEYEPTKYEFSNERGTSAEITQFIKDHCIPLVGERSTKTRFKYDDKYPLVVVYYDVDFSFEHRVRSQLVRKEVLKVAKDYVGKVTFAISNEERYEDELIALNLDDSGEDVNVGYYESEKLRYRMPPTESFSAKELKEFIEKVHAGKVPRHIKSQPAPKTNKGPVITVVGSTFDELVTKSKKDVLLEFYAPWCGHCKKLEPVYKKLAKAFSDNDNIIISKIDATANDYPDEFKVTGFPSIFYIPGLDKNNMISYDGDRSLKDLTAFVNKNLNNVGGSKDEL